MGGEVSRKVGEEEEEEGVESVPKKPRLGDKEVKGEVKEVPDYEFQWEDTYDCVRDEADDEGDDDDGGISYKNAPVTDSDDDDYMDADHREQFHRCLKQIEDSDGFDLDFDPPLVPGGFVRVRNLDTFPGLKESLDFAVNDNNSKDKRPNLVNHRMLKATTQGCEGSNFYITFEATDTNTGLTSTYQTTVWCHWTGEPQGVYIFRPKPQPNSDGVQRIDNILPVYCVPGVLSSERQWHRDGGSDGRQGKGVREMMGERELKVEERGFLIRRWDARREEID
ncbi:hypothetical protein Tsubulata_032606 [Turnera subulata]|uniref:Cystatin domain-containing protein n=1 Tax=Turnera subulata TaxID=218843 RepID=A0A9Q0F673_9ROSI|nr:hypothetical protein Tsubulata_032606 [Turnera subulata]